MCVCMPVCVFVFVRASVCTCVCVCVCAREDLGANQKKLKKMIFSKSLSKYDWEVKS